YFDVEIEYAKADAETTLLRITAHNRSSEEGEIWIIPQVWFRNTWSWESDGRRPVLRADGGRRIVADHPELGTYEIELEGIDRMAFCENETNAQLLYGQDVEGPFKDGIHELVVHGDERAVRDAEGTKGAGISRRTVQAGQSVSVRLRLKKTGAAESEDSIDEVIAARRSETDVFYAGLQNGIESEGERRVQRQALAGMLWSKQTFIYDVRRWLQGDPGQPSPPEQRKSGRNADWKHFNAADVLSMPDAWEYPWFAAWDLAFHCIPFAMIDPEFAKRQLLILTKEWYMHPNGQLPAYEWAFGDVNPPVHAWSSWRVFQADRKRRGDGGDLEWLERIFIKLLLNFTWWVNRKDRAGNNLFQGGFLGLDNIGVFDRSAPLPTGGYIDQSDGTAWMAMYSLNMMRIALELSLHDEGYEDIATKFFEHFLYIVEAMHEMGGGGLWDEEDQFFYDWLELPGEGGSRFKMPLRVRSMVGLIPLYAVQVLDGKLLDRLPKFRERIEWFLDHRPELAALVSSYHLPNDEERRLLSIVEEDELKAILARMLDESEFLSEHGVRALSRFHREHPFRFEWGGETWEVAYNPAESDSYLFGGNSNWRGPIWMPVNYLLVESLHKFHHFYGDAFKFEFPTGSGRNMNLLEIAEARAGRLASIFL
ncbi:MAG: glucosidase, partial [Thermoanaerobaculia bacterium]|nr:glucosidase [Thermoanaerobaculia bacterium]